ncbi:alpha/beta hydrolase [Rhizobium sp. PL01]|uniref:alpha/beta hydrolase n=1 Tax=Rhizobium sp. PL01 TaxID=3085631 RepID=UPI0029817FD4|nr:alpha/beta hydrolase [Rhizobium sp. PL01]MDW5318380.1 alpha/beta hydrolase [Rhizobium sp. PL01]
MMSTLAEEGLWPKDVIDRDYNARASVTPEVFEAEMGRYRRRSDEIRAEWLTAADIVYDEASGQALDIYGTAPDTLRPVFIFIHGGYWRALSKAGSAFMAGTLGRHGIATAVLDYRLAPAVGLDEIVREIRAAIAFIWRNGACHGLDPQRIYVGGSSAGGHLTGSVITGGWHVALGVPEDVVKGAMPISGLFHLAPIAQSFVQEWLRLPPAHVAPLSPAANIPAAGCPIVLAYADGEPAGFRRQSTEFDRLWREAGFPSTLLEVAGRNHFDVLLDLAVEDSALTRALLKLIGRGN